MLGYAKHMTPIEEVRVEQDTTSSEEEEPIMGETAPLLATQLQEKYIYRLTKRLGPWAYLAPATLYAISNNLVYYALVRMTPPLFTLLVNLKIPLTGVMAWMILSKNMGPKQWLSLVLMSAGTILALLRFDGSAHWATTTMGTLSVMLYAMCSATAAVMMECITRHVHYNQHVMTQNLQFAVFSTMISLGLITSALKFSDFGLIQGIHFLSMFSMVANGFMAAIVIKYAGSIVKTHAVAMSSIVTALLSYIFWPNQVLPWNYFVGSFLCLAALRIYILEKQAQLRLRNR